jgi:hypothetical protein
VKTFQDCGEVSESTKFPSGDVFSYSLKRHTDEEFEANLIGSSIQILVPEEKANTWKTDDQVSMESSVLLSDDQPLRILIEKDFACLTEREHEDESDNFPNPNITC